MFRRLTQALLTTWLIATLVFLASRLFGDDPAQQLVEQAEQLGRPSSPAVRAASRQLLLQRLGLDQPLFYATRSAAGWQWHGTHNQYHAWVRELGRGELGRSYQTNSPVSDVLLPALTVTLPLMGTALVLAAGGSLLLALVLAGSPSPSLRAGLRVSLTGLQALPLFLVGLLLLLLLANPDLLDVLPASDEGLESGSLGAGVARLALPVLCLVLTSLPELTLPLAGALRRELASPYILTARAKGLPLSFVLWRHALPNALAPQLAGLAGLLPALVAGAIVVESLFALPGMGRVLAQATAAHDYPVLTAGVLLTALGRLLGQLLADSIHYLVDPRLRPTA